MKAFVVMTALSMGLGIGAWFYMVEGPGGACFQTALTAIPPIQIPASGQGGAPGGYSTQGGGDFAQNIAGAVGRINETTANQLESMGNRQQGLPPGGVRLVDLPMEQIIDVGKPVFGAFLDCVQGKPVTPAPRPARARPQAAPALAAPRTVAPTPEPMPAPAGSAPARTPPAAQAPSSSGPNIKVIRVPGRER